MGGNCDEVQLVSAKTFSQKLFVALLLVIIDVNLFAREVAANENSAYCSAYCDIYDNLIESSVCSGGSNEPVVYCCGTTYNKTCCTDPLSALDESLPDETVCGHSWIYYQWSLIYGLVAVLMVILMIVICCICCRGYQIVSRRNTTAASRQERGESEVDAQSLGFDPSCEYAFEPPRYETLPKDPPKYSEVFSVSEHENAAFTPDEQPVAPIPFATTTATTATALSPIEEQPVSDSPVHKPDESSHSSSSSPTSSSSAASLHAEPEAERSCHPEVGVALVEENGTKHGDNISTSTL